MHDSAALYLRLSKEDGEQGESSSIANQRSLLRQRAEKEGLFVYREYVDDGFSGTNFDRPAFLQMLQDIEAGKVDTVLTKDLSRLGRDYIQTGYYLEKYFPEHGVRYISLLDQIDSAKEEGYGNDMTPFRTIINDLYAKDISKKIRSVKHDQQRKGLFVGGKAPYGYRLSENAKNTFEIDEVAAAVVRKIFQMALEGKNGREIADQLNREKISTPLEYAGLRPATTWEHYSGIWKSERVLFLLKNEVYIGNMVQGRVRKVGYKSKKIFRNPREQWMVAQGTHEAIVDKTLFEQVQHILQKRAKTRVRKYDYLWKELLCCAVCGGRISATARCLKNGTVLYLGCRTYQKIPGQVPCFSHMIREDTMRRTVMEYVRNLAEQSVDFGGYAEQVLQTETQEKRAIQEEKIAEQQRRCERFLRQLYADRAEGILEKTDFQALYSEKKAEQKTLEQQRKTLMNQQKRWSAEELVTEFWQEAEREKGIWYALLERIEILPNQRLHLYFRCSKPEFCS